MVRGSPQVYQVMHTLLPLGEDARSPSPNGSKKLQEQV
jgi:hypothetical protein